MSNAETNVKWDNVAVLDNAALVPQHAFASWFRHITALRPEHCPFNHISHPPVQGLMEYAAVRR
jgi:hypothetical protein